MSDETADLIEYVRVALRLQRLEIDDTRRTAVTHQFRLLAAMAEAFMEEPLPPDMEPAPIYRL